MASIVSTILFKKIPEHQNVELFIRKGKRLIGLTEPGKELIGVRKRHFLRGYAYKFIELSAAEHTETVVRLHAT